MHPDYQLRRNKLLTRINRAKLNCLLVTSETNVTYLTGFTGDSSWLLIGRDITLLASDTRYTTQIEEECSELDTHIRDSQTTQLESVAAICKKSKINSLGIESSNLTKSKFDALDSELDCELVDTDGWIETLRAIKDKSELAKIRTSIRCAERAFEVIKSQLTFDQTEREIAHNLEHQIRKFGGTECAFDPIVGVGDRSALPHGVPGYKQIEESGFVLIDWGAKVNGYASDLTRVLVTGKILSRIRKIYEIVLDAQQKAISKIRPGVTFKSVDAAARQRIQKAGFGKKFGHGLGHGFGLQIHEEPFINPIKEGILKQNMVVTIEPGIYLPGVGGVRIEDDVLVTRDGCEVLSSLPKTIEENTIAID